jgi:RimJ/RimL family protein N-acetyltransferase
MTITVNNSARLSFALMDENDSELLFQLDQDPEVMHFINGGEPTSREEISRVYIPRMQSYTNKEKGWGLWKVTIIESQQFIGWILVRPMDFFSEQPQIDNLELGWRFMQASWGKGYATEAAQAIKKALIAQNSVKNFTGLVVEDNFASIAIMKKLGMNFVKKELHRDPIWEEEVLYYQIDV